MIENLFISVPFILRMPRIFLPIIFGVDHALWRIHMVVEWTRIHYKYDDTQQLNIDVESKKNNWHSQYRYHGVQAASIIEIYRCCEVSHAYHKKRRYYEQKESQINRGIDVKLKM